jgi:hypothetical protein
LFNGFQVIERKRAHAPIQPLLGNGANLIGHGNHVSATTPNGHEKGWAGLG